MKLQPTSPALKAVFLFTFMGLLITPNSNAQESTDKASVQAAVDQFFKAFHAQDSLALKEAVTPGIIMQTIGRNREGETVLRSQEFSGFIQQITQIPDSVKFEEKLLSYSIQIDGPMANAWTEYEFWVNGNFSHCGVNSFHMVKQKDQWKINYLVDTRRREGCNPSQE